MEIEKVIELLKAAYTETKEESAAVCAGADALRKQIPSPLIAELYYRGGHYKIFCPCGEPVSFLDRRCKSCGQALDWDTITDKVVFTYGT